jgi:hypothetical protein
MVIMTVHIVLYAFVKQNVEQSAAILQLEAQIGQQLQQQQQQQQQSQQNQGMTAHTYTAQVDL